MKIMIIGCNGQLGYDMTQQCAIKGYEVCGIDYPKINITDYFSVIDVLKRNKPSVIINCAAYAQVDQCETARDEAYAVNSDGVENVARGAQEIEAKVVHFSTDYVFDGMKGKPYLESDEPNPLSVYGKSKYQGEKRVSQAMENYIIIRTAWLYGAHGNNFVKTIWQKARENSRTGVPLKIVNDQYGSPTYTKELCEQTLAIVEAHHSGIFHCTNEGVCTWYEFASEILSNFNNCVKVQPCTTEEFPRPAFRPPYSVLENARLKSLGIYYMRSWKDAFCRFFTENKDMF